MTKTYARIVGGVVVNVEVWGEEPPAQAGVTFVESTTAKRGDAWNGSAFSTPAKPVEIAIAEECARIDAESDRRDALDLSYDFETTPAILVTGATVPAGVRALQMGEINIKDWQGQQARALAAVTRGEPLTVIKVIVSDNATVMAPAEQFLQCFEAGCQRKEANAVWRVQRKALVRAQTTAAAVAGTQAATDAGWP